MLIVKKVCLLLIILFVSTTIYAQQKIIIGVIKDADSEEGLPFVSVSFKNTNVGTVSDSVGNFMFSLAKFPSDTLLISSVGYKPYAIGLPSKKDSIYINALLKIGIATAEVVVRAKAKHSRGWYLWQKVVAHKFENNVFENNDFYCQVYNKLEVDINNINTNKLDKSKLLKPFSNILKNNIDSISDEKPILPVFLSETISDFYYQKKPYKTKEIILGNKVSGLKNESLTKYLGAINQKLQIYNNFITLFNKDFASPLSSNGDAFYNYKLADTQYLSGKRLIHLLFFPKYKGQNSFSGDCWVHDSSFAIQKINLRLNEEANINFINKLTIVQDYVHVNNNTWFLSKDKFYISLSPMGSKKVGFIAKKTANYDKVIYNSTNTRNMLANNKIAEEVSIETDARAKEKTFWDTSRLEKLSKSEQGIYAMVDSLQEMDVFKRYVKTISTLATGFINVGKFQLGPWMSWISGNPLEGTRVRFDLGTNKTFSKKLYLHGYLAYGFKDKNWKQKAEIQYLISRNPWQKISASYSNDLNFSLNANSRLGTDNAFATAFIKTNIPTKFINLKQTKIEYFRDTKVGFSFAANVANKIFEPLLNLPKRLHSGTDSITFNTTEIGIKLRYAFAEKIVENNLNRISLGSKYPITELEYIQGIPNILQSKYSYQKIRLSVSHVLSIAPYGKINYTAFAGKVFGRAPYMMLEVHPGNEVYFYNKNAFNLMNRYEFISDKYAGIFVEHNVGNGIFKFTPITRKLKLRQFYNVRTLVGNLSYENVFLNRVEGRRLDKLNNKVYVELGTGIENIFNFFRVDFVWRVSPYSKVITKSDSFGVFGSFKLQL